jgi:hypothetical protein
MTKKKKKRNFIAALLFISMPSILHVANSNYLITDTPWDGLAAEWRSKLYRIEEVELKRKELISLAVYFSFLAF